MPHPWVDTNVCVDCKHKFKDGETKVIREDWSTLEEDRHFQKHPKRWAECVDCARREKPLKAAVPSYKVQHKAGYSGGT